ncbi:MAG: translation initiation factor eIF-1A [Sulfolobales archaeon]|nr:translation initiation factor eIF-1A [Sulfolobales archaeon]MCX8208303.1 translation initiation factor eIF-1A [Sulfolobales archaeon]MDW8010001.1 translation initiation factor eIF-1A [Sulfolobales archaeon]
MRKLGQAKPADIPVPEKGTQVICVVSQLVGANYVKVVCADEQSRVARIPGKLRKKVWISPLDVVLVELWAEVSDRGDVIYKYSKDERKKLVEYGYLDPKLIEYAGGTL